MTLASRAAVTAADVLVVAITWLKTYRHVREASQLGVTVSVSAILLRDGENFYSFMRVFAFELTERDIGSLYFAYVNDPVVLSNMI